jgi:hypothetical protein
MSDYYYLQKYFTRSYVNKIGSEGYLEINKADIKDVQVEKFLFAKKAIVTLADGSKHTFNYGALNVDRVAEAIRAN